MPNPVHILGTILLHQGDAADPELIHWIKERMDEILGVSPWMMVVATGTIVVAIPVAIGLFYFYQQRRGGTPLPGRRFSSDSNNWDSHTCQGPGDSVD